MGPCAPRSTASSITLHNLSNMNKIGRRLNLTTAQARLVGLPPHLPKTGHCGAQCYVARISRSQFCSLQIKMNKIGGLSAYHRVCTIRQKGRSLEGLISCSIGGLSAYHCSRGSMLTMWPAFHDQVERLPIHIHHLINQLYSRLVGGHS